MANIIDAEKAVKQFVEGFEPMIRDVMVENREEVSQYIVEQLWSGINGNDKPLRPTYFNDPYFNTKEAGYWYKNAKGYAAFKEKCWCSCLLRAERGRSMCLLKQKCLTV